MLKTETIQQIVSGVFVPYSFIGKTDGEQGIIMDSLARVREIEIKINLARNPFRERYSLFYYCFLLRHPVTGVTVKRPSFGHFTGSVTENQFCISGVLYRSKALVENGKLDFERFSSHGILRKLSFFQDIAISKAPTDFIHATFILPTSKDTGMISVVQISDMVNCKVLQRTMNF